jgi:hypothetical protein
MIPSRRRSGKSSQDHHSHTHATVLSVLRRSIVDGEY